MIKFKLTTLQENILRFMFVHFGMSFNARRLAGLLGVSQPAISKALVLLSKKKLVLIKKDKESKRLDISLNIDNSDVVGLKRCENLRALYESGLVSFLDEKFFGSSVILFGSYSRGDDYYDSDIDIAVIGMKSKNVNLRKFERVLEKEIRINFYESLKGVNKNLRENIFNGVVLLGGIEL